MERQRNAIAPPELLREQPACFRKALTNEPHSTAEAHADVTCEDAATKCTNTNPNQLVSLQDHLNDGQKTELSKTLQKCECLFEGLESKQLGFHANCKHSITLEPDTKACHAEQSHSIPLQQIPPTKKELNRQVNLGIIKKCCSTEWGMPMFVIPKNNGSC